MKGKLRTSGLCCSLLHLAVHIEMTGNTIERLMYERVNVVEFGSYKDLISLK